MVEEILIPKKLPDDSHAVIVVLETINVVFPEIDTSPLTHEALLYKRITAKDDVAERIKNASVVITTTCPITEESMKNAPYL
jgi:glycerate dehydrogenase